jgi:PTS system nitrogen regulatory IIA component
MLHSGIAFFFNRSSLVFVSKKVLHKSELVNIFESIETHLGHNRVSGQAGLHRYTLNTSLHLADSLEAGGVFYEVPGGDLESVLRATIARFPLPQGYDRASLLQLFMARESLGSTAIGDGIALPHIRFSGFPPGFHAPQNLVALSFLKQLIPYKVPDDKPVRIVISVVSSTVTHYFRIFRQLSNALHDASFRKAVMERQPCDQILQEVKRLEKEAQNG